MISGRKNVSPLQYTQRGSAARLNPVYICNNFNIVFSFQHRAVDAIFCLFNIDDVIYLIIHIFT